MCIYIIMYKYILLYIYIYYIKYIIIYILLLYILYYIYYIYMIILYIQCSSMYRQHLRENKRSFLRPLTSRSPFNNFATDLHTEVQGIAQGEIKDVVRGPHGSLQDQILVERNEGQASQAL